MRQSKQKAMALIETEDDDKYRKKYASVWRVKTRFIRMRSLARRRWPALQREQLRKLRRLFCGGLHSFVADAFESTAENARGARVPPGGAGVPTHASCRKEPILNFFTAPAQGKT